MRACWLLVPAVLTGACDLDHRQARLCAAALAEVEGVVAVARRAALAGETRGVAMILADGRRFECRFRGGAFQAGQSELLAIRRLDGQILTPFAFAHLRRQLGLPP